MAPQIRINKLLSQFGIASRRKADEMILQGKVSLNGDVLKTLGVTVDTKKDRVVVEGRELPLDQRRHNIYCMINKPKGYVTTIEDTHGRKTIMELLPTKEKGLFPVGRLDMDTTGLIIVTNDGELAYRLMHPKYGIAKVYEVELDDRIRERDLALLEKGVDIKDKRPSTCKVLKVKRHRDSSSILLEIHEGRKRQLRRTFEALGYKIRSLRRINYACLKLDIRKGSCRELSAEEVQHLRKSVGLI